MNDPYPLDDVISTVTLDSRKVGYKFAVSSEFMRQLKVQRREDFLIGELDRCVYELWTHVRTKNLPPEHITQIGEIVTTQPATWWQHWRRDVLGRIWGLRWTARRWPIRTTKQKHQLRVIVGLERFHIYPDAPDFGGRLGPIVVPHHSLNVRADWIGPNRKQGGPTHTERPDRRQP